MEWRNDRAIYLQVIDLFKKDVITGVYRPKDKILSVREYAIKLGVNPNTIVKVYDLYAINTRNISAFRSIRSVT